MSTLTEQLHTLKSYGMEQTATEPLAPKNPPSFIAGLQQLIEAEAVEWEVQAFATK